MENAPLLSRRIVIALLAAALGAVSPACGTETREAVPEQAS